MKIRFIFICIFITVFVFFTSQCNNKEELSNYENYKIFDEYELRGIDKLSEKPENNEYVSIRFFSDSIKVYSHRDLQFYNYYKRAGYWLHERCKKSITLECDIHIVKYIFNDTIVEQRYLSYPDKSIDKNESNFFVNTKNYIWGLSINTNSVLNKDEINNIIKCINDKSFPKNKYFVNNTNYFYLNKRIVQNKLILYSIPKNYIPSLPENFLYTYQDFSKLLNSNKIVDCNTEVYETVYIDSIPEMFFELFEVIY